MAYRLTKDDFKDPLVATQKEWLITNGIGGFAMGTATGLNTRRYHGFLIAATSPPTGRMLLFPACDAFAVLGKRVVALSSNQYPDAVYPDGIQSIVGFEYGSAVTWNFKSGDIVVDKRLELVQGVNQCNLSFVNRGNKRIQLRLNPLLCCRDFHANFVERDTFPAGIELNGDITVIREGDIQLRLSHAHAVRRPVHGWYYRFDHPIETERGLNPRDDLYCPFELEIELDPGATWTLMATTEPDFATGPSLPEDEDPKTLIDELKRSAGHFLVKTENRTSIMAGYPWFSDWGRDTMIAIPGICLQTGEVEAARQILRDYASQMSQGLIPNRFVEKGEKPDYNTVDATLWFGNAIYRTLEADQEFAVEMLSRLRDVVRWHRNGTYFGIVVDPEDGLLKQGEHGLQLTWMDAKIGDWVVTPRHGKPVEINGLWINLLRVSAWLAKKLGEDASPFETAAKLASAHFEKKFWHETLGYYLDTAEPNDASLRPNQVIAMSLPFTPCDPVRMSRALKVVEEKLLTPVGLRTLSPDSPNYVSHFRGPMNKLDEAYHQGTVWPWLFGPYVRAQINAGVPREDALLALRRLSAMTSEFGLGGVAECYDAEEPYKPGGCPWQAWSVAEALDVLS
ncbi:MAG TPA: amylo-alpha-1,6-glucosidase [Fimbriimonas sp.]|nr:amylo-alpha-1,6-glucosidase [Fimbriimonas sp.]